MNAPQATVVFNPDSQADFPWPPGFSACIFVEYRVYSGMNTTTGKKLDYQRDEHRVHVILYLLIWYPKRRKPILFGKVKEDIWAVSQTSMF